MTRRKRADIIEKHSIRGHIKLEKFVNIKNKIFLKKVLTNKNQ
ncbi:hypothetical protein HMPREF3188_01080, partial [Tissierellia bacterium KA00581]